MNNIFFQLASVLGLSCLIGFVVLRAKLPLVVSYLLAGVLLSAVALTGFNVHGLGIFEFLPELGIAFVLFLIGMELDLREIRALGWPIIVTSVGQSVITTCAGYAIAANLGFTQTESLFFGIGLAFSSTIVVIKLLLDKRDLASLYGKLALGITLVEDLIAVMILMVISVGSSSLNLGLQQSLPLLVLVIKAIGLFILTFVLSRFVLERVFDAVAKSVELLFLTAITWCFIFTSLAIFAGFSVVIGAFLAGVALASSPYHLQIQGKIKPLRDFFVTMFFIYLGSQATVGDFLLYWQTILIFTIYALLVKPVIMFLLLGAFGFRKHTFFQAGLSLSQISEFSLVIVLVGVSSGLMSHSSISIMAAVAVFSIIISSVTITYSKTAYQLIKPLLWFFERNTNPHFLEARIEEKLENHVVMIGAHRVGGPVVKYLKKEQIPFVVMDFNPHIVEQLRKDGIKVIYGDIDDPDILDNLQLEKAKLIISTATDLSDNEMLLGVCKRKKVKAKIVTRATDPEHADALKALGADYVILPERVSGHFLVNQLKQNWPNIHFSGLD